MSLDTYETLSSTPVDLTSVTGRIAHQHFKIRSTLDELEMTLERLARGRLGRQLAVQLRTHAALVEAVLYPLVQRLGGDAAKWVQQACQVHRAIVHLVEEMAPDFSIEDVALMHDAVTRHIEDEESRVFPLIEELDEETTRELTQSIEQVEREAEDDGSSPEVHLSRTYQFAR